MASTPGNKRPNPAQEQRDALNQAVSRGAITSTATIPAAPSSLDTFNVTRAPSAAETAAAAVTLDREDDGINEVGESGSENNGGDDLNDNQSAIANEKDDFAENIPTGRPDDDPGYEDDSESGSPFDVVNPGRQRLADEMATEMADLFDEGEPSGGGSAAGRRASSASGGGGDISSSAGGGNSLGGESARSGGGGGGVNDARNPFTGQGIGVNAYGTPGIPGVGDSSSKGSVNDPLVGLMMDTAAAASQGSTSPSVADGGSSDPLGAAIAHAKTQDAQNETAKKAGVTPSTGSATGGASPAPAPADTDDDSDSDSDSDEPGIVDRFVAWVKEQTTSTGPSRTEQEVPEEVGIGGAKTTNAAALEAVDVKNLETAAAASLGAFANHQKGKGGTGVKDPGPDGSDVGGPPSESEIALRAYLRGATNYHGSPGHNEGVTNPTPEENPTPTGTFSMTQSRDMGHALFGQPSDDGPSMRGGPVSIGMLPGDRGDVDPGEDSDYGPSTSNPQTEQPEDALEGFGSSGLSIGDARRNADEEEEEEDDDQTS